MKNTEAYPLDRLVHPPMMMPALPQDNPPGSEVGIPMLFRPAVAKIVVAAFTLLLLGVGSVRAAFWLSDVAGQEPDLGIAEVKDDWSSVSSSELLARADRLGAIIAEDEEAYALAGVSGQPAVAGVPHGDHVHHGRVESQDPVAGDAMGIVEIDVAAAAAREALHP